MTSRMPISRRRLLGILGSGALAGLLNSRRSAASFAIQDRQVPKTNISDALKHPRVAESLPGAFPGRVVRAFDGRSLAGDHPDPPRVEKMLADSMCALTGASTVGSAWARFVSPADVVGLKVNPVAGKLLSTSPELVRAIIHQIESAGVPRSNIVIWDRREFELYEVGFTAEAFPGIRIVGTERKDEQGSFRDANGKLYSETMIDRDWYYWADVEEHYDEETLPYMVNQGKESYFSRICTRDCTKIINVPVLKNAGSSVTLCMKNLAFGSITNTSRLHRPLWHETCAEVPAFPPLRDHVVLNIVDGIKGCYQGGPAANPEFITGFNTLLVGTDPVAVDRIGYGIILQKRLEEKIQKEETPKARTFMEIAEKLGLGVADEANIDVTRV